MDPAEGRPPSVSAAPGRQAPGRAVQLPLPSSASTCRRASKHRGSIALPTVSAMMTSVCGTGTAAR